MLSLLLQYINFEQPLHDMSSYTRNTKIQIIKTWTGVWLRRTICLHTVTFESVGRLEATQYFGTLSLKWPLLSFVRDYFYFAKCIFRPLRPNFMFTMGDSTRHFNSERFYANSMMIATPKILIVLDLQWRSIRLMKSSAMEAEQNEIKLVLIFFSYVLIRW